MSEYKYTITTYYEDREGNVHDRSEYAANTEKAAKSIATGEFIGKRVPFRTHVGNGVYEGEFIPSWHDNSVVVKSVAVITDNTKEQAA